MKWPLAGNRPMVFTAFRSWDTFGSLRLALASSFRYTRASTVGISCRFKPRSDAVLGTLHGAVSQTSSRSSAPCSAGSMVGGTVPRSASTASQDLHCATILSPLLGRCEAHHQYLSRIHSSTFLSTTRPVALCCSDQTPNPHWVLPQLDAQVRASVRSLASGFVYRFMLVLAALPGAVAWSNWLLDIEFAAYWLIVICVSWVCVLTGHCCCSCCRFSTSRNQSMITFVFCYAPRG